jgi:hypothetical protein
MLPGETHGGPPAPPPPRPLPPGGRLAGPPPARPSPRPPARHQRRRHKRGVLHRRCHGPRSPQGFPPRSRGVPARGGRPASVGGQPPARGVRPRADRRHRRRRLARRPRAALPAPPAWTHSLVPARMSALRAPAARRGSLRVAAGFQPAAVGPHPAADNLPPAAVGPAPTGVTGGGGWPAGRGLRYRHRRRGPTAWYRQGCRRYQPRSPQGFPPRSRGVPARGGRPAPAGARPRGPRTPGPAAQRPLPSRLGLARELHYASPRLPHVLRLLLLLLLLLLLPPRNPPWDDPNQPPPARSGHQWRAPQSLRPRRDPNQPFPAKPGHQCPAPQSERRPPVPRTASLRFRPPRGYH